MNAAHLELVKLDRKWEAAVKASPDTPLFVFSGKKHDMKLVETYFKAQHAEDSRTDDKYLILFYEFRDKTSYTVPVLEQWNDLYKRYHETEQTGISGDIPLPDDPEQKTDAYKIIEAITYLNRINEVSDDIRTFILLMPYNLTLKVREELEEWIADFCRELEKKGLQQQIKLAVLQYEGQEFYKKLPENQKVVKVEMDISGLMQNLSSATSPKNASVETDFQQQILLANNYLSKNKNDQAKVAIEKAVRLGKIEKKAEWECIARLLSVFVCLNEKRKEDADREFDTLRRVAGEDNLLAVQMHLNYASFLFARSRSQKAEEVIEKTAGMASRSGLKAYEMECYRILGDVKAGIMSVGVKNAYYEKGVEVGLSMPPEEAKNSSLAYIACKLIENYGEFSEQSDELNQKLAPLLGENWYSQIKERQQA